MSLSLDIGIITYTLWIRRGDVRCFRLALLWSEGLHEGLDW
jgi:hypothetical protein